MTIPAHVSTSSVQIAVGNASFNLDLETFPTATENLLIVMAVQKGTGTFCSIDTGNVQTVGVKSIAGVTDDMTLLGPFDIGSAVSSRLGVWLGRTTDIAVEPAIQISNPAAADIYMVMFQYRGVSLSLDLDEVIENSTAGSTASDAQVSATVNDVAVTTLGPDRLACNFIGVGDDNTLAAGFTGETGGDWSVTFSAFSSLGSDASYALMTAPMESAGTIDGGSLTMVASDPFGVVGFALIGAEGTPLVWVGA